MSQNPIQEALEEAKKWVSPEELERYKESYRDLARMNTKSPIVRMIAALDRAYNPEGTKA